MSVKKKGLHTGFLLAILPLAAFCLLSCLPRDYAKLPETIQVPPQALSEPARYRIQTGDILSIKFPYTEAHNEEVVVMPDGSIAVQVAGKVAVTGLTTEEASQEIRKLASVRLRDPQVIVSVKQSSQRVYVGGEVGQAGPVPYREGLTALQAIIERQGFKDTANWDEIILIRLGKDGYKTFRMGIEEVASIRLETNDAVFVPKTGVAKVNLAVKQFIRDMVPIPVSYSGAGI